MSMKDFIEAMEKDLRSENFTKSDWVLFGIIAPLVLLLLCCLSEQLR